MKATDIRVEYLNAPLGISIEHPVISWNCEGGKSQSAFRILFKDGDKVLHDTGKIESSSMSYTSPIEAVSRGHVDFELTLYDETGKAGETSTSSYEYALLKPSDWSAKWISGNYKVNNKERYPVDCFKKEFEVTSIKKARLYITACGVYEARINGRKVGDFHMAPGYTDYTKRIQLQTYDVTDLLKEGTNVIEVELADGWYRGAVGAWGLLNAYGTETKFIAQLEVVDKDLNLRKTPTDHSWAWSNDGPIRFADNKDGEVVDFNKSPSYSVYAKETKCDVFPTPSNNVGTREGLRFKGKLIVTPSGKKVIDFGQNVAGIIEIDLDNAKKGDYLFLRFGEMLDKDGEFTQKNIQVSGKKKTSPLQEVKLTLKEGKNHYKTKFSIWGFQYVLVEGNADWKVEDFTSIAVSSDLEETSTFESSNPLLDKFVLNTLWSARNNHFDIPTDCPTRERHGWTGDAQIFCKSASYLFTYAPFARKYVNDMNDSQRRDGCYLQISPRGGTDFYMKVMDGSAGWSDAGVLIPYRNYLMYGDRRILEDNYASMKRYARYKIKTLGKHYLTGTGTGIKLKYRKWISNYGQSYGEWAEPEDINPMSWKHFVLPNPEESTAYIVYLMETMEKIATILGHKDDARYYADWAKKVRKGYQELVKSKRHPLDSPRQCKTVRPLYLNLLTPEQEEFAKKHLIKVLEDYDWRLGTGFLSTPFILYVLEKIDVEYAYKLLENEKMPGWLFMPKSGANTVWENWEGTAGTQGGIASLDHYSKGALVEWVYSRMLGINVEGERHFVLSPVVGGHFTHAKGTYKSIYGTVKSSWERKDGKVTYTFEVPVNCSADVILMDGTKKKVESGRHVFVTEER